jgi:NAD(P)-dependent dehydrogenase (short-subunit alcohol dehydrogenase family)
VAGSTRSLSDDVRHSSQGGGQRPAVLITGGAKRLGAQIARTFGQAGWQVIVHCHSSVRAAHALAQALPDAQVVQADLADEDAVVRMCARVNAITPDWRVLVNCASVFEEDAADGLDRDVFDRAMRVNARAPARLAQCFLAGPALAAGRRVIQVTDQKIANPNPDFFSYTMSKHALASTVRMLAMHHAGQGADRIYGLAPGAILPSHDQSDAEAQVSHRMNLLQRRTLASEVADAALFLATGALASGETLFVDSGQHLLQQDRDVIYLARGQAA